MPRPGPLADLKVLDLSRLLPGPYATLVLADLGADVVKIEDPAGGDYLRWMPPLQGDTSALFLALNRGKRSVALDLKTGEGRQALRDLVTAADVLVESFRPGVLERLGLGWEALQQLNRRLVLCSISGYGQGGPYAGRAGHDLDYLALGGVLDLLGGEGELPGQPNVQIADIAGGALTALVGILSALLERSRTGAGRWVDTSMTEGAMSVAAMALAPLLTGAGEGPRRGRGVLSGEVPCYAVYRTSDGRALALGALEPKFWAGFCRAIERPDLADDGLDAGPAGQRARAEVTAILSARPLEEWVRHFAAHDVCIEPVLQAEELVEHPLHRARGTFFEGPHGLAQRAAVRFADDEAPPATAPAPGLGADREAVVREWLGGDGAPSR